MLATRESNLIRILRLNNFGTGTPLEPLFLIFLIFAMIQFKAKSAKCNFYHFT